MSTEAHTLATLDRRIEEAEAEIRDLAGRVMAERDILTQDRIRLDTARRTAQQLETIVKHGTDILDSWTRLHASAVETRARLTAQRDADRPDADPETLP